MAFCDVHAQPFLFLPLLSSLFTCIDGVRSLLKIEVLSKKILNLFSLKDLLPIGISSTKKKIRKKKE